MTKHYISNGDRFGRLTVVRRAKKAGFYLLVQCDCGTTKVVYKGSLISGATQSCGCLHSEIVVSENRKRRRPKVRPVVVDLPGEEWRRVEGWPAYYVSNKGRVKREWPRKDVLLKLRSNVGLHDNGRKGGGRVAVLVLKAFIGPAPIGKPLARHLDDDILNNNLENLAWGSYSDNMQDALRNGRHDYRSTARYRAMIGVAVSAAKQRRREIR